MPDLADRLHNLPTKPDAVVPHLEAFVAEAEKLENPAPLYVPIFRLFERYPDADFGMPGPLVHFLEAHFPDYIDPLIQSMQRLPTYHTVWMVNRLLNAGVEVPRRDELQLLLERALEHPQANDLCRETARSFLSLREDSD